MNLKSKLIAAVAGVASLCSTAAIAQAEENVVNVYSARHYATDELLFQEFENQTGIQVNRVEAKGDKILKRLLSEGDLSPADVLITVDAGRLWKASEAGVFQTISSDTLDSRIPENLRNAGDGWYGLSTRSRIIFYNPELIEADLIQSYEDLAKPELKGKICIRSGSNIYNLSLLSSMIEHHGAEKATEWAQGVVNNMARPPQGGDRDQIKAAAAGECAVAVANSYYFAGMMASDDPKNVAVTEKLSWVFPNQADRGAHVNVAGAGVVKTAPHKENAIRLLEFLAGDFGQQHFAEQSNEYPVVSGIETTAAVDKLGTDFKADTVFVDVFGIHQAQAQMIMDQVGWK